MVTKLAKIVPRMMGACKICNDAHPGRRYIIPGLRLYVVIPSFRGCRS